jgi:hypothetical protein
MAERNDSCEVVVDGKARHQQSSEWRAESISDLYLFGYAVRHWLDWLLTVSVYRRVRSFRSSAIVQSLDYLSAFAILALPTDNKIPTMYHVHSLDKAETIRTAHGLPLLTTNPGEQVYLYVL